MSEKQKNIQKLYTLFDKYSLSQTDREYILSIITIIFDHEEFQRRMTKEFMHHSDISLGEHIIEDTIITYLMSKKYENINDYNTELALKVAMLHDLYCVPWQNNKNAKEVRFFNKHGFRHPIEAAINALYWYPELFEDEKESRIILDGIIHHMYPLPVQRFYENDYNELELNNYELLNIISKRNKELIYESTNRNVIKNISISKSIYKEGRIMSRADKKASVREIKNISSGIALLTGHNESLKKNKH